MPNSLFETIHLEFHGGPVDGDIVVLHRNRIREMLFEVEKVPNMVVFYLPTQRTKTRHRHFYLSNGPMDLPILESHIDLYYEGIAP